MLRAPGDYDVFIDDFAEGESRVHGINWLAGASLVGSTIKVETAGANLVATPTQDTAQRFRLSGGTAGERYSLVATSTGEVKKTGLRIIAEEP